MERIEWTQELVPTIDQVQLIPDGEGLFWHAQDFSYFYKCICCEWQHNEITLCEIDINQDVKINHLVGKKCRHDFGSRYHMWFYGWRWSKNGQPKKTQDDLPTICGEPWESWEID